MLWAAAHQCALAYPESVRRAGFEGEGLELGEALFDAVLASPSGVVFTVDEYDETWRRVATADGLVNLVIPELLAELDGLGDGPPTAHRRGVPVRPVGRRAPLVDGQHDLPRPDLAEEGRSTARCG